VKPGNSSFVVQPNRSSLLVWMLICLAVALALVLLIIQPALAQKKLTAAEAKDHVGERATVCGNVVSTRYAASNKGAADISQSGQAISKSNLHHCDLGYQSEQIWQTGGRLQ